MSTILPELDHFLFRSLYDAGTKEKQKQNISPLFLIGERSIIVRAHLSPAMCNNSLAFMSPTRCCSRTLCGTNNKLDEPTSARIKKKKCCAHIADWIDPNNQPHFHFESSVSKPTSKRKETFYFFFFNKNKNKMVHLK